MSILDFVTQSQLDDLDEDPRLAFMELVNIAQRSLHAQTEHLDDSEQHDWRLIEELRLSFMNVVLAAAKRFEIEPFHSMDVPQYGDFQNKNYLQFKYDLDHFITQLVIDNSLRSRANSVEILPKSKETIRTYIHGLRTCIENANMVEKKRTALLRQLDALEAELEKRRVSMVAVARVAFALWAIPGSAWASYDVANKLISNVMHTVAEAKEEEDRQRVLPTSQPHKALSPPRRPQAAATSAGWDDLDGDIPF